MSKTWSLCLAVFMAVAIAGGCQTNKKTRETGPAARTEPVSIIRQVSASDEGFKQPEGRAILTRAELEEAKSTELTKLDIDFNKQSLVVVALGEEPTAGYWVKITGVQQRGTVVYVQGVANRPVKDQQVAQQKTYPVAAAVVPRLEAVSSVVEEIDSVEGQDAAAAAPAAVQVDTATTAPAK